MKNRKISPIIKLWFTPKFPEAQIKKVLLYRPEGLNNLLKDKLRTWVIHPVKRRLAKYYLKFLHNIFGIKIIAITGSCGKTSTKDMTASVLSQDGETVSTFKNIDPIYNIPTTILRCKPSTKYLVLEMGVEYPNEMDFYLWMAVPEISVITNIYLTHTEFFKDMDGVAKEKEKLAKGVARNGTVILNKENKYLRKLGKNLPGKCIYYGKSSNIYARNSSLTNNMSSKFTLILNTSKISIQLPTLGEQFISNSLAAAAVAHALGIPSEKIKKGLEEYKASEHRMNVIVLKNGAVILDDSYNNNPEAAKEAVKTLKIYARAKKIIVFGDMLELGNQEIKYHRLLGKFISQNEVNYLIGVGKLSKYVVDEASKKMDRRNVFWTNNIYEAIKNLKPHLKRGTVILIKGSRSIGLERMVAGLS